MDTVAEEVVLVAACLLSTDLPLPAMGPSGPMVVKPAAKQQGFIEAVEAVVEEVVELW